MEESKSATKRKPFRFSAGQDIALLKAVQSLNPQGRVWLQVAEALNEAGLAVDSF